MADKKIKMCGEVQRYLVMAHDDRFAILVKPMNAKRTYLYSTTDLERKVRGPVDLIFGLNHHVDSAKGARALLAELQSGKISVSRRKEKPLTEPEIAQLDALSDKTRTRRMDGTITKRKGVK